MVNSMKEDGLKDTYKDFLKRIINTLESDPFKSEIQEIKRRAIDDPKQINADRKKKLIAQIKELEDLINNTKAYVKTMDI